MIENYADLRDFLRRIRMEDLAVGITQGQIALMLHQLEHTLGPLADEHVTQVRGLPNELLLSLATDLLSFTSVADLTAWLAAANRYRAVSANCAAPPKPRRATKVFTRMTEVAQAELVLRMLERRIGRVSAAALIQLHLMHSEQLCALGAALFGFTSADDLTAWLAAHVPPEYNDYASSVAVMEQYRNRHQFTFVTTLETSAQGDLLVSVLTHQFARVSDEHTKMVTRLHSLQLLFLAEQMVDFTSADDLTAWLAANPPVTWYPPYTPQTITDTDGE
ncbi:MAG: DUF4351 domain-containing protein [Chloroflexaceae bacterium]|nr:DUF4351 domain-containing protein [Chloroflexaceae bacterium]